MPEQARVHVSEAVDETAGRIYQGCRDEARKVADKRLAEAGLDFAKQSERDLFQAGVEAGIAGAMTELSRRFNFTLRVQS